jgi:transposase
VGGDLHRFGKGWQRCGDIVSRLNIDQGTSLRQRGKRGEQVQAIGRSRGGRTTKIHALSDADCRPHVLHLTPGHNADIAVAPEVLALAPPMRALIADKGYDGDALRADIVNRGAKPVIPNKSNRIALHRFNKRAYAGRNVIERCFCRLKDFRRVATR